MQRIKEKNSQVVETMKTKKEKVEKTTEGQREEDSKILQDPKVICGKVQ